MEATHTYLIRPMESKDICAVASLSRQLWEAEGCDPYDPCSDWCQCIKLAETMLEHSGIVRTFVAESFGILVFGCITGTIVDIPNGKGGVVGGLFVMYKVEQHVAFALTHAIAEWYYQNEVDTIRINADSNGARGNRKRAFHKRLGFQELYTENGVTTYEGNTSEALTALDGYYKRLQYGRCF